MKTEVQETVNAATERKSNLQYGATNKLEANLHNLGMRREKKQLLF